MIRHLCNHLARFILLLFWATIPLAAQKTDMYRDILKESLKPNFKLDSTLMKLDSISYKKLIFFDSDTINLDTVNLTGLALQYRLNYMYDMYISDLPPREKMTISPYLTMPYTNQSVYDPKSTETTGAIISNALLRPIAAVIMINPVELFQYLMRIGVLPDEPFVPTVSRREQTRRTITKDVYHIDDAY
jgi:hypothetical protein